jgi:hypothetical protein
MGVRCATLPELSGKGHPPFGEGVDRVGDLCVGDVGAAGRRSTGGCADPGVQPDPPPRGERGAGFHVEPKISRSLPQRRRREASRGAIQRPLMAVLLVRPRPPVHALAAPLASLPCQRSGRPRRHPLQHLLPRKTAAGKAPGRPRPVAVPAATSAIPKPPPATSTHSAPEHTETVPAIAHRIARRSSRSPGRSRPNSMSRVIPIPSQRGRVGAVDLGPGGQGRRADHGGERRASIGTSPRCRSRSRVAARVCRLSTGRGCCAAQHAAHGMLISS